MADPSTPHASDASPGPWRIVWRKLLHNRVACTGGVLLVLLYVASCLAGFLSPYDPEDASSASTKAPPSLFGGYDLVQVERTRPDGTSVTVYEREWSWFSGGVHFHDSEGRFTLRPHVHPLVEKQFQDEYGETVYRPGCSDRNVSLPIEFFVSDPHEREMVSVLGFFPLRGHLRLFGVKVPPATKGDARVYLLGSDARGRDMLSRLLHGSQISLSVGVFCIVITMSLGMLVGGWSGYHGGWFDLVAMRVVEVILSVPYLYLIIVLGGVLRDVRIGGRPLTSRGTYFMIVLVMAFVGWAGRARVIRGMVLSLRERDYVVAAQAIGISRFRTIAKHVLPNTFSFAIVSATLAIPSYILGEVALSFLGLGIQEPEASWGNMLRDANQPSLLLECPWVVVPGVFIFLTVLAYNFLGDGLRDATDPRAVIVRKYKSAM